ncbi:MAG: hypothetical protein DMD39_10550 [Gemmatimonadetes bacterium]|nr:MAG: hypothetical protein DMD39_10550 [Gemmatimonadota bacterium]
MTPGTIRRVLQRYYAQQATVRPSATYVGSGETADFELTPDAPGDLRLEIDRDGPFQFHVAVPLHLVAK